MSIISNTILAFSMSADAFAASIAKGVSLRQPKLTDAMRIGFIFGVIETLTPIIGWLLGITASRFIESFDHWIAFGILTIIGAKMVWEGLRGRHEPLRESHTLSVLILTAIGTSIDAMAVGATLAFINANIWIMALMIGSATFMMTTIGIMTGHYIGQKAGKIAEGLGGLCLIAIGIHILLQHLGMQ